MVILHAKSPEPIALSIEEGNLFPLPLTASGKVLLAFLPQQERDAILKTNKIFKAYKEHQKEAFLRSLDQIKLNGFYMRTSDLAEGVVDVSVPVGHTDKGVIACLTVSRLTTLNINKGVENKEILSAAITYSKMIEKRVGV